MLAKPVQGVSDEIVGHFPTAIVEKQRIPVRMKTFEAIGKQDYRIMILDDANHLFQKAETGAVSEYARLPKEFAPGFLEAITAWARNEALP